MNQPNSPWQELVAAIHASRYQSVLAVTGGGSSAISQLLQVPGSSQTVLEALVPYAATALANLLDGKPGQSCSQSTARAMAMQSWRRANSFTLADDPSRVIGLGATASLASDRPKQGEHRLHVATQTATSTVCYSLTFTKSLSQNPHGGLQRSEKLASPSSFETCSKNARDRLAEETLAAQLILLSLADACQVNIAAARESLIAQLQDSEKITTVEQTAEPTWTDLLIGQQSSVCYPQSFTPRAIFPGAFNPPHAGHRRIAQVAAQRLGCPVAYELSITNVDKPPLDFIEINTRLCQLQSESPDAKILLTDAPTFRSKARLFPGCTFIVGADTIARIADPSYYTGDPAGYDTAIQQIADHRCRFLVFGREIQERFCGLSDLELPVTLKALCDEVPALEFRADISSTSLRK